MISHLFSSGQNVRKMACRHLSLVKVIKCNRNLKLMRNFIHSVLLIQVISLFIYECIDLSSVYSIFKNKSFLKEILSIDVSAINDSLKFIETSYSTFNNNLTHRLSLN